MDRDDNSADNILARFFARRGPHTSSGECGVLHEEQNSVEVTQASCPFQVQQQELWWTRFTTFKKAVEPSL
jgi:putative transposase